MNESVQPPVDKKSFVSDQEIRWCPGCGDRAIFNAIVKVLPELDIPHENFVFVSGIGCSSRFPYYLNTYGFHTIHGRAAAIATGLKMARPELCVWEITGDGDSMAIGGNHFIHLVRRNVNVKLILFNNQIYGLTKGQYSPTSFFGSVTKSSPYGTVERPFHPGQLTIGALGTFFARSIDTNISLTREIMFETAKHRGTSVVEIYQNCVIFNDNAQAAITDKEFKDDRQIILVHGQPMLFGRNKEKGLVLHNNELKIVYPGKGGYRLEDVLVHDVTTADPFLHLKLVEMEYPDFPVALGVIRAVNERTFEDCNRVQIEKIKEQSKIRNMTDLLHSGHTWTVE